MTVVAPVAHPIALTVAELAAQVTPLAVTADTAALIENHLNDHAAFDVWLTDTDAPTELGLRVGDRCQRVSFPLTIDDLYAVVDECTADQFDLPR